MIFLDIMVMRTGEVCLIFIKINAIYKKKGCKTSFVFNE